MDNNENLQNYIDSVAAGTSSGTVTPSNANVLSIPGGTETPTVEAPNIGTQEFNIPEVDTSGMDQSIANANATASTLDTLQGDVDASQQGVDNINSQILSILGDFENKGQDRLDLEKDAGIAGLNKDVLELGNLIRNKTASLNAGLIDQEGRPIPMKFITGRQRQMKMQAAYEIEALGAAMQAKQGYLSLAQNAVTNALNAKYEGLEAELDTRKFALDIASDALSGDEAELLGEQKRLADIEAEELKTKKAQDKEILGLVMDNADKLNNATITALLSGEYDLATAMGMMKDAGVSISSKSGSKSSKSSKIDQFAAMVSENENMSEAELYREGRKLGLTVGEIENEIGIGGVALQDNEVNDTADYFVEEFGKGKNKLEGEISSIIEQGGMSAPDGRFIKITDDQIASIVNRINNNRGLLRRDVTPQ